MDRRDYNSKSLWDILIRTAHTQTRMLHRLIGAEGLMLTLVSLNSWLQVGAFGGFLAAIALDVGRTRLAVRTAMLTLGYRTTLLVNMLERTLYISHELAGAR